MANEKRLIDADALLKKQYNSSPLKALQFVEMVVDVRDIEDAPTVDAVEVVHGRWQIITDDYDCEMMCCSVCKAEFYDGDNDTVDCLHNYCPNCGAKMDGGNEDV